MFCYRVVDDCVVRREFKKKFTTDEELSRFIVCNMGTKKVAGLAEFPISNTNDLFDACKEATVYAEDLFDIVWYESIDQENVLALALIHVIDTTRNWALLQDKGAFEEWLKTKVR